MDWLDENFCKNVTFKIGKLLFESTIMTTIDNLRNNIIDKLLTISDQDYLKAIYKIVENSSVDQSVVHLTDEQILMLQLSDDDIEKGRLIPQTEVDQQDLKWLKEL